MDLYPRTSLKNTPNLASHTLPDNSPQFSGSPFAPKTPPTPQGEDEEKGKREKEEVKEAGEDEKNPSIEGTPVKQEYIDISHLPLGEGNPDISTPKCLTKKTSRKDLKRLSTGHFFLCFPPTLSHSYFFLTEKRKNRKSSSLIHKKSSSVSSVPGDQMGVIEKCSRCCVEADSLNRVACLSCQQYFCSSCQKLGVLKNPCSNGRAHHYLPTEPTEDKKK